MCWTDEDTERLIALWQGGHSAAAIARKIGGGVSRSAVLGKANRLGLRRHPGDVVARQAVGRPKVKDKPAPAVGDLERKSGPARVEPLPMPLPTADDVPRKPLSDLDHGDCRWPVTVAAGTPDERHMFCARPAVTGSSYCGAHLRRAHSATARVSVPPSVKGIINREVMDHADASEFIGA